MTEPDSPFERARSADIEAVAGVKLYRAGRRLRGECPICGASAGKKAGGAFSADPSAGLYKCFACDKGGDIVDLERELRGGTAREAAERLSAAAPIAERRPRAKAPPVPTSASRLAADLWREAARAPGSPVETYLAARGITGPLARAALRSLRYHPSAWWGMEDDQAIRLSAMIAQVASPAGLTGGVHVTYLAPDGRGKTHREPAKRMFGAQNGVDGPGGCWLIGPGEDWNHGAGPLIVGEGIESALSAAVLQGGPVRVAAALSLGRLQGGWLTDRYGRIDPAQIAGYPDRPAFTWPCPAASPWPAVSIAVDRDMGPLRVKVRRPSGGTCWRVLESDERARICAGLATAAWGRLGDGGPGRIQAIGPGPGRDFNTELRARLAAGDVGQVAA